MKNIVLLLAIILMGCQNDISQHAPNAVGAMKNVMWKGELDGIIRADTIRPKEGLYGLGPLAGLQGELLINDGEIVVSTIDENQKIRVKKTTEASAPFFVYAHNSAWNEKKLPKNLTSTKDIEKYLKNEIGNYDEPFVFKLMGDISSAKIHVQNLSEGTKVRSPKEAHQGQVDFDVDPQSVEIIGFYSTRHQGVFTHHDSYIHMHLITDDGQYMGHLDEIEVKQMKIMIPKSVLNN